MDQQVVLINPYDFIIWPPAWVWLLIYKPRLDFIFATDCNFGQLKVNSVCRSLIYDCWKMAFSLLDCYSSIVWSFIYVIGLPVFVLDNIFVGFVSPLLTVFSKMKSLRFLLITLRVQFYLQLRSLCYWNFTTWNRYVSTVYGLWITVATFTSNKQTWLMLEKVDPKKRNSRDFRKID